MKPKKLSCECVQELHQTAIASYNRAISDYEEWLKSEVVPHLKWLRHRIVYVYKESPNVDFILKFDAILTALTKEE